MFHRPKNTIQGWLELQPSNLQITNEYFQKYQAISKILDSNPNLLARIHCDLKEALDQEEQKAKKRNRVFQYSSEHVLRIQICQIIENESLRGIIVRIDDSHFLRKFTRIGLGSMMDFSTFGKLRNAIQAKTWKQVNQELARLAVEQGWISGKFLRLDTTAVETNIHWPTDSSLLWDGYRTLARLIEGTREIYPKTVGKGRVHLRRVKRYYTKISRKASHKTTANQDLQTLYKPLVCSVEGLCQWAEKVVDGLQEQSKKACRFGGDRPLLKELIEEFHKYLALTRQVLEQTRRRVFDNQPLANEKKLFSLFEPHTELLIRGKAGKPIEFGHMVEIEQVKEKLITNYEVFEKKPAEPKLLQPALENHKKLFGCYPQTLAADKGYWPKGENLAQLEKKVNLLCIAKKGKRNPEEEKRETDPLFRHAQRFRAGVEGTISFLKRVLGMWRCLNKGWKHYAATLGATIFAHNLLILARC